jgi:hypothetical protein
MMDTLPQSSPQAEPEQLPLGQRLYDNWLLLMIAGIAIMAVIYTGWGLWEIAHCRREHCHERSRRGSGQEPMHTGMVAPRDAGGFRRTSPRRCGSGSPSPGAWCCSR